MRGVALSDDGAEQAGMGVGIGDYDLDGHLDLFKTHFADDASGLYHNDGAGMFDDVTRASRIGVETRYVGWGAGIVDLDNDGYPDLFMVSGNVYPDVERKLPKYREQDAARGVPEPRQPHVRGAPGAGGARRRRRTLQPRVRVRGLRQRRRRRRARRQPERAAVIASQRRDGVRALDQSEARRRQVEPERHRRARAGPRRRSDAGAGGGQPIEFLFLERSAASLRSRNRRDRQHRDLLAQRRDARSFNAWRPTSSSPCAKARGSCRTRAGAKSDLTRPGVGATVHIRHRERSRCRLHRMVAGRPSPRPRANVFTRINRGTHAHPSPALERLRRALRPADLRRGLRPVHRQHHGHRQRPDRGGHRERQP